MENLSFLKQLKSGKLQFFLKEIRTYIESEEWEAKVTIINSKYD